MVALTLANDNVPRFYADWSAGTCIDDGNNSPWDELYGKLEVGCKLLLQWATFFLGELITLMKLS